MRGPRTAAAIAMVALVLLGCGGGDPPVRVLRMASADPRGIEHDPAVAFFRDRVERLSGGRVRIQLDERWARDATAREAPLLRDVARGEADLGWAHAGTFDRIGVDSFQPLEAPLLVDRDAVQDAVVRGPLAARMLAGARAAGLEGLALLAGPFIRLAGANAPMRSAADLRRRLFAVRDSALADASARALHAFPTTITAATLPLFYLDRAARRPGAPAAIEDDLDALFFDRYGGPCRGCGGAGPWVTTNVVLWPHAAVLVANPRRLRGLTSRERAWLAEAARQAARYSTISDDGDARLAAELCAAGARLTTASPSVVAGLRRALRPVYRRLEAQAETRATLVAIERIRGRTRAPASLAAPPGCASRTPSAASARGVPSTLRDGTYRVQLSRADLRAAGDARASDRTGTATLTLRRGRWRLAFTEPPGDARSGTYAGTPLRTAWATDGSGRDEAYFSITVGRDGALRFRIGGANDVPSAAATYASHAWRRIGG
ncbi:MAG: TRAP-type transport system periplasmic protein [Solirubrobacteraceae bacterium]|nr:TRAP-type transport system periplasmic protein [Solirubrobacteraceae bacterium]